MWDANNWYLATHGDLGTFLKTTNAGATWEINKGAGYPIPVGTSTSYTSIHGAYFFDMNTGILACGRGLTRTTNGGTTFDSVPGTHIGTAVWRSIFFTNNMTGYICGDGGRLAKTTDQGESWIFNSTIPNEPYYDVYTINDTLLFVTTATGNVVRSSNGGQNWSPISTGISSILRRIQFLNKDTGVVAGTSTAISITTNGGLNWSNINNGLPSSSFYDIDIRKISSTEYIYVTGNPNYIYKTSNLGVTWDSVSFKAPSQNSTDGYACTYFLSDDTLMTVGGFGLINVKRNLSNELLTYLIRPNGVNTEILDIWAEGPDGKVWAVGTSGSAGADDQIIFSSNGGASWSVQASGIITGQIRSISMVNGNSGFASAPLGKVVKTTNSGNNWTIINTGIPNDFFKVHFVNANTGWAFGSTGGIVKTTNSGINWEQQSAPNNTGFIIGADFINENTGFLCGDGGRVSKTTNGGLNWFAQNPSGTTSLVYDIEMVNENTAYLCGDNSLVRKTTDGGVSWSTLSLPFTNIFTSIEFIDSLNGMLGGWNRHILRTSDGGQSWQISRPGGDCAALDMVNSNIAYTGGFNYSLFITNNSLIGISTTWENLLPERYDLAQNYPNPFNPSTKIKFAIPRTGKVTLKIFDIAGREIATLIDNLELNRGVITQSFDGSSLSSGIYFYSLIVDNVLIDSKKMVLLK